MNKCTKCGAELTNKLSFCPKCGEMNLNDSSNISNVYTDDRKANKPQKKNSILIILLWIMLFPVMVTINIIKSDKLNKMIKCILLAVLWFCIIVIGGSYTDNSGETNLIQYQNEIDNLDNTDAASVLNDVDSSSNKNNIDDDKINETEEVVIKYHDNETINRLLKEYNSLAQHEITSDMVRNGAYSFSATVSCNDVYLMIYINNENVFINYSQESTDDSNIFPLFRDFARTLNPKISEDEIQIAFDELRTGNWDYYHAYNMNGIECSYYTQALRDDNIRYLIKTGYGQY